MSGLAPHGAYLGDAIRASSPLSALGLERLWAFLEEDSALPASHKALLTAAAAAAHGRPALVRRELERARRLGISAGWAHGSTRVVLLNRGADAHAELATGVAEIFGPPEHRDGAPASGGVDEALAYFAGHFGGEVPERQRILAEVAPAAFESFYLLHRAALKENELPERLAELLLCTLVASTYIPWSLSIHMRSAMLVGATEAELAEAVLSGLSP